MTVVDEIKNQRAGMCNEHTVSVRVYRSVTDYGVRKMPRPNLIIHHAEEYLE